MYTECAAWKFVSRFSRDEICVLELFFDELSDMAVNVVLPIDCVLFDLVDSARLGYLDIPTILSVPWDDADDDDDDDEVRSEWKQDNRLKHPFGAFLLSSYLYDIQPFGLASLSCVGGPS